MADGVQTAEVWSQFHERLLSFIRRQVRDVHDAEDILQDVFVRIHSSLPCLKDIESITAWVYRIARNAVTDYYRKRASAAKALGELAEDAGDDEDRPDVTRETVNEFSRCLEPLMSELSERHRQAMTLTELNGLTQEDAARQLGLSIPGMKARVQRGRRKLRDVILNCCSVELDRRGGLVCGPQEIVQRADRLCRRPRLVAHAAAVPNWLRWTNRCEPLWCRACCSASCKKSQGNLG